MMASENLQVDVGQRLRALRERRGLSMRALARQSGLSANALSLIERGRTSPSVSTLYKLAEALSLPITEFFQAGQARERIVHRRISQRRQVPFPEGLWEGLGGEAFIGRVEPFMLTLEGKASSGESSMAHSGHEFVLCLEGTLEYEVEGQRFLLEEGDSLLFAAQLEHRWRNPGTTLTRAVFVLSGFQDDERPAEIHFTPGGPY